MKLYKYLHQDRIEFIKNGLIRFTQPGAFNDPYEMQAFINHSGFSKEIVSLYQENFDDIAVDVYSKFSPAEQRLFTVNQLKTWLKQQDKYLTESLAFGSKIMAERLNQTIFQPKADQHIGVLCLTEKPDNLLMWAHYANSHEGFVVELDCSNEFFSGGRNNSKNLSSLNKVKYKSQVPQTSLLDMKDFEFALTKSKEWEYEQEWRMALQLEKCHERIPADIYDICLFKIPIDCISRVILGCRSTKELEALTQSYLPECTPNLRIQRAQINRSEFGMYFEDILS